MDHANTGRSGIGLSGAMFLLFLALKITGNIDWSWWAVTSPLWVSFCLVFLIAFTMALGKQR